MQPFHLAIAVDDLEATRTFYTQRLGAGIGRESDRWIDFDLFGHQVTAHLRPEQVRREQAAAHASDVDGDQVPIPHFGVVLDWDLWNTLAETLKRMEQAFVIPPRVRFAGKVGEQGTMFLRDPAGNALEFKAFRDPSRLFASEEEEN